MFSLVEDYLKAICRVMNAHYAVVARGNCFLNEVIFVILNSLFREIFINFH